MEIGVIVIYDVLVGSNFELVIEIGEGIFIVDEILIDFSNIFVGVMGEVWYKYMFFVIGVVIVSFCGSVVVMCLLFNSVIDCCVILINFIFDQGSCFDDVGFILNWLVFEGEEYYIFWDNVNFFDGFDFIVSLGDFEFVDVMLNVDMQNEMVVVEGVSVVVGGFGVFDFNDVIIQVMFDDDGDGIYLIIIQVMILDIIGYVFVNGGVDFVNLEVVFDFCGVLSGFGFNVCLFINILIFLIEVDVVCFVVCEVCLLDMVICDEFIIIWIEDFEGQIVGVLLVNNFIIFWLVVGIIFGDVSFDQVVSGFNFYFIMGDGIDVDLVYLLFNQILIIGYYVVSWNMYIFVDFIVYFNFQKDVILVVEWVVEVFFNGDGIGDFNVGVVDFCVNFIYLEGEWFLIVMVIDIDNDFICMYIDGQWVFSWLLNFDVSSIGNLQLIGVVNYYLRLNEFDFWYVDDFMVVLIFELGDGLYCQMVIVVELGVIIVEELDCFGGGLFYDLFDGVGLQACWFSYIVIVDGYISVSVCGGGVDICVWILVGDCGDFILVGVNDDCCEIFVGGSVWVIYCEVLVIFGEIYYIVWDDIWEVVGFDWELMFNEGDLFVGDFCEFVEVVDLGIYIVEEFGEVFVGGYCLGYFMIFIILYFGGVWYFFMFDSDGMMSINFCGIDVDIWLFVYIGDCGLQFLELIVESDDDCIIVLSVEDIEVMVGMIYYIEWIDWNDVVGFDWELIFNLLIVNVQMVVDVFLFVEVGEFSLDGVFLAGSFSDFNNVEMFDLDGDNIYMVIVQIFENFIVIYKFKNGFDGWENIDISIGDDCMIGEFNDCFVEIGIMNILFDLVCFGYCVFCQMVDVSDVVFEQGVFVFFNFVKDVLNVQIDLLEVVSCLNICLVNVLGQVVLSCDFGIFQSDNIEFDVCNFVVGIYMLQVVDGQVQFM